MASNLSQLIEDSLSSTLASLLSKETILEQTNKASAQSLTKQCIKIDTTFKFENIESSWVFFIPALSATYILNLMMGDDSEPTEDIDDDTIDALNEVVSNICGGLSTTINGSEFEDLGSVQFSLEGNEKITGEDFKDTPNFFKFTILVDNKPVYFFIAFDNKILPYIETITASEVEVENKITEGVPQENNSEEIVDNKTTKDDIHEDKTDKSIENKPSIFDKINFLEVDETLSPEDAKNAKLKKIIIIVGALFGMVILVGIILFFMGTFDPTKIEQPIDTNTTKPKDNDSVHIKSKMKKKNINFTINKINTKRLNRKLNLLTKYEILEEDAIENKSY